MTSDSGARPELPVAWKTAEYYSALRDLVKHEDGLLNERVKIMVSIQTLLFGVVAVFWQQEHANNVLLAIVGIVTAISYGRDIANSAVSLGDLTRRWSEYINPTGTAQGSDDIPPLVGKVVRMPGSLLLPGTLLPWAFLVMWLAVLATLLKWF